VNVHVRCNNNNCERRVLTLDPRSERPALEQRQPRLRVARLSNPMHVDHEIGGLRLQKGADRNISRQESGRKKQSDGGSIAHRSPVHKHSNLTLAGRCRIIGLRDAVCLGVLALRTVHAAEGALEDGSPCLSAVGMTEVRFDSATVNHSNLGGFGPDLNAPQTIRLNNVAPNEPVDFWGRRRRIDLEISNLTAYEPFGPSWTGAVQRFNGLGGASGTFGVVVVRTPPSGQPVHVAHVVLRYRFLEVGPDGNDTSVTIGK
jgi:hypothetical protein